MALKLTADADDLDHLLTTGALQPHLAIPAFSPANAPSFAPPSSAPVPNLDAPVPILQAPTKQESQEAGKREFQAGMPQIAAEPFTPGYYKEKQEQIDYKKEHPWGSPISAEPGFIGKVGHALADVGNIAGNVVAPGIMEELPSTKLGMAAETAQNEAGEQKATQETTAKEAADTEKEKEKAAENQAANTIPVTLADGRTFNLPTKVAEDYLKGQAHNQTTEDVANKKPPTPEEDKQRMASLQQALSNGTISDADRQWLAGQQRAAKTTGIGPEIIAQAGQPPVPADFPKGDKDPAYVAANETWGKKAEDIKNAEAGASGAARGAGYNSTRPVQVLIKQPDGSMASVYMTAGQAEAGGFTPSAQGQKSISQQAQFDDINNAISKVGDALDKAGNSTFNPSQIAKLTLAMEATDPTVMHNEISALAASGLTPPQQDLVTWLQQLQERALSLRSIAGMGQGSETTRAAILKALPNLTSGNVQMAHKQLDALQNMVNNLHRGILNVKGNENNSSPKDYGDAGGKPDGATGTITENGNKIKVVVKGGRIVAAE